MQIQRKGDIEMVNICLCDDDLSAIDFYRNIIQKSNLIKKVEINEFKSGESLLFNAEEQLDLIDIIIIDVNLCEISGIETVKKLRNLGFLGEVIFLTKDVKAVFDVFQTKALDFLIKDFNETTKFLNVLKKAVGKVTENKEKYLILHTAHKKIKILKQDIVYIESRQRKMYVVTITGESYECYMKVTEMLELVDTYMFTRIHKSFIVNFEHALGMEKQTLLVSGAEILPIGRGYTNEVKDILKTSTPTEVVLN